MGKCCQVLPWDYRPGGNAAATKSGTQKHESLMAAFYAVRRCSFRRGWHIFDLVRLVTAWDLRDHHGLSCCQDVFNSVGFRECGRPPRVRRFNVGVMVRCSVVRVRSECQVPWNAPESARVLRFAKNFWIRVVCQNLLFAKVCNAFQG
jgi:hypothetical protein